jgi:hypothetical protein
MAYRAGWAFINSYILARPVRADRIKLRRLQVA